MEETDSSYLSDSDSEFLFPRQEPLMIYTLTSEPGQPPSEVINADSLEAIENRYKTWDQYKRLTPTSYRGARVLLDTATITDEDPSKKLIKKDRKMAEHNPFKFGESQEQPKNRNSDVVEGDRQTTDQSQNLKIRAGRKKSGKIKVLTSPGSSKKEKINSLKTSPKNKRKMQAQPSNVQKNVFIDGPILEELTEEELILIDKLKKRHRPAIWVTADVFKNLDHEAYVSYGVRDLCFYLLFLTVVSMFTFGVMDNAYNYYASVISEVITHTKFNTSLGIQRTFYEITTIQHIWDFINKIVMKVIYENNYDESRSLELEPSDTVMVLYNNILVGVPSIRLVRTLNDSCKVHHIFGDFVQACYGYFSKSSESKDTFGLGNGTPWVYNDPSLLGSPSFTGKISTYGGGGYSMNLTYHETTKKTLRELLLNDWIQLGTRAVFIDFTTYTPNTNLFCVVKLIMEIPPTGLVVPTAYFYTMKFLRYVDVWDHIILVCEIIFLVLVVYYTIEEILELLGLKEQYTDKSWNVLDVSIVTASYAAIVSGAIRYTIISLYMKQKVENINKKYHANFDNFVSVQLTFNTIVAVLSFLVWVKFLKFAALNRSVALVLAIFVKVSVELISLLILMIFMIFGFGFLGHLLFGSQVEEFTTVKSSMFTLVGLFVGGLYFYKECENSRPYAAPVFFVFYILIVILFFLNCFIALIVHGFYLAHEDFEDQRERVTFWDICRYLRYKLLRWVRKYDYADKLKYKEQSLRHHKSYEVFVSVLKRHGIRELDLALILKKYEVQSTDRITFSKMDEIYRNISARNQLYLEVEQHDKIIELIGSVNEKIEFLEITIADMMTKVDILVDKLLYREIKMESKKTA